MRIHLVTITTMALMSTGLAIAATPAPTGKQELGIDITQAGTTARDHQVFVKKLPADQQASVLNSCMQIAAAPADHAPAVVTFCNDVKSMQSAQNKAATAPPPADMLATVPPDAVLSYNVIGLEIYNGANEDVGEIKDLVIEKGQVVGFITAVGGFLGLGERYVVLNPAAVRITYDEPNSKWRAAMDVTKDQLKNAPEFKYEGKFKRAG